MKEDYPSYISVYISHIYIMYLSIYKSTIWHQRILTTLSTGCFFCINIAATRISSYFEFYVVVVAIW